MANRSFFQALSVLLYNPHVSQLFTGHIWRGQSKSLCVPGLNCYSCPAAAGACPVGALQSFLSSISPRFPAYVIGSLLTFGLLFGRMICGWGCPFGFLQDMLYRLPGPKLKKSPWTVRLSKLKYLWAVLFVLVLPLGFYFVTGVGIPAFCTYLCPAGTLEGAVPLLSVHPMLRSAAGGLTVWKFAVLGIFLVLMVFVSRPFCRWLCPLGAFYGCLNRHAMFGIAVDKRTCIRCGKCAETCGMDTKIAGDRECISCGKCISRCPMQSIHFRSLSEIDPKIQI